MPIQFTCPHCGTNTNVADQYVGQSGPCINCGKTVTIPGASIGVPFDAGGLPPRRGLSTGWIVFIVLASIGAVVLVCGGILTALMLPAVSSAREAATQTTTQKAATVAGQPRPGHGRRERSFLGNIGFIQSVHQLEAIDRQLQRRSGYYTRNEREWNDPARRTGNAIADRTP